MPMFSRVVDIELVGPTSIGLRLTDDEGTATTDQILISPANFITDFSVFLTAVRAGGETRPVDRDSLCRSWEEAREMLRRRLIEEDPWAEEPLPSPEESTLAAMTIVMGEERAEELMAQRSKATSARGKKDGPSPNEPPSDPE